MKYAASELLGDNVDAVEIECLGARFGSVFFVNLLHFSSVDKMTDGLANYMLIYKLVIIMI